MYSIAPQQGRGYKVEKHYKDGTIELMPQLFDNLKEVQAFIETLPTNYED